jgi:hypothetical protein
LITLLNRITRSNYAGALDTLPAGSREVLKELAGADQGDWLIVYETLQLIRLTESFTE